MQSTSTHFYKNLQVLPSFEEATNAHKHVALPGDWYVIVTDVAGSTAAIQAGRYKDVNSIGGATIASILNVDRSIPIPFVFGGDGATLVIPQTMLAGATSALLATREMAQSAFGLELRIGIVPVSDLYALGESCGVAKWRLSQTIEQAAFSGRGWEKAEQLVKDPAANSKYLVKDIPGVEPFADYSGFECRWKSVPSRNGSQLALLVASLASEPSLHNRVYAEVMAKIEEIFGEVHNFHPLTANGLRLSPRIKDVLNEAKVSSKSANPLVWGLTACKLLLLNFIGMYLFRTGTDTKAVRWSRYRQELVENTDFRKFDGVLRMVIDGSEAQQAKIQAYLDKQFTAGTLCYGIHKSSEALVTCIVFSHDRQHTHFVDGGDGGYALAAKMLKEQLRTKLAPR